MGSSKGQPGDCHVKWHDPAYHGKLYADMLGHRKRKRNEAKPTWSEPTSDAMRVAVERMERLVAEQFADDLRHAQMQDALGDE